MPSKQNQRTNFAVAKHTPGYPDFLDIQIKSFQDFFQLETKSDERDEEGLFNTFKENFQYQIQEINLFLNSSIISLIHQDILYRNV